MDSPVLLILYVCGKTARSERALMRARALPNCQLEVVDVLENPELAERDQVLATPTLIRREPPPLRRLVGDLADPEKLVSMIGCPHCL